MNETNCNFKHDYSIEEKICYLYIMCPIALIGIILNILCLRVYFHASFNTVAFSYLRIMSWIDLIICSIVLPYCLITYTNSFNEYDLYARHIYLAYFYIPLANLASNLTMLLTVLVTIERLVSITSPIRKVQLFKKSRYNLSIALVILIALLTNIINFFLYKVELCENDVKPREFTSSQYWIIYGYLKELLMRVIPIILLISANIILILTIKNSQKRIQSRRTTHTSRDSQLTKMTIFVVTMYSICSIPMIFAYPGLLFTPEQTQTKFYKIYAAFTNILELCQSSFRFLIYFCFTTQFRVVLFNSFALRKTQTTQTNTNLDGEYQSVHYSRGMSLSASASVNFKFLSNNNNDK